MKGAGFKREEMIKQVGNGMSCGNLRKCLIGGVDCTYDPYTRKADLVKTLVNKMEKDDALKERVMRIIDPQKEGKQVGKGDENAVGAGLMSNEIDDAMSRATRGLTHKWYLGTVPYDRVDRLDPKGHRKYGFIFNTDKAGEKGKHWIAVYVDLDKGKTVEIYDPLANYIPSELMLRQIKMLVEKNEPEHYLLLKVNQVKNQANTTDTCGYHAMRFLIERAKGNRWKFSTGWTDLKEDEIEKFKKQNGGGKYNVFL